ncbi:MAG: P-loop NTPase [Bacilli bacterium]
MEYDINLIKQELIKQIKNSKIQNLEFIDKDKIYIKIGILETEDNETIKNDIIRFLKLDMKIPKVKYEYDIIKEKLSLENAKKIIISSGKGGVGKSFVTANIANVLSKMGYKVAVIDADIYGSSIPMIFDLEDSPQPSGDKIFPLKYENIELIGTSNVNPNNEAIVWRGPMLGRLLNSFFRDVCWSEDIDYLLIDLPPGTGDVPLDLNKLVPDAKCIVVTTPHINASKIAVLAGEIAKMQKHELIGVVENMSYYLHNEEKLYIFGKSGGEYVAKTLDTTLLEKLPISSPRKSTLYSVGEDSYKMYENVCRQIKLSFEK